MSRGVVKRGGSVASLRRRRTMIIAASAALAFQACSSASTFTWTGSGTALASAAWDYSSAGAFTNWNPALVLPSSSDDVVFGSGFASGNPNLNGSRTVRSLTIDTASGVSLAGASSSDGLTLTSGGLTRTAASSGTQTINVSVTPGSSALWNIGGSGALVLNGQINAGDVGTALRKFGTGTLVLATPGLGGAFAGDLSHSTIEINAGAVVVTGAAAKALPSNLSIKTGTFSLSATTDIAVVNTLSLGGPGVLRLNGSSFSVDTLNGTSNVSNAGIDLGGGSLLVNSGGTYFGNITGGGGEVYIAGGSGLLWSGNNNNVGSIHVGNAGAASLGGFFVLRGTGNALVVANGGSLQIGSSASVSATSGAVRVGEFAGPDGVLTVGGSLSSPYGAVGASGLAGNTGGRGRVIVAGQSSSWQINQSLAIGGDTTGPGGIGTLVVADQGTVQVLGVTRMWTAGSVIDVNAGRLQTAGVVGAPGIGAMRISDGSFGSGLSLGSALATDSFTFAGSVSDSTGGPGSLDKYGPSRQTLTGVVSYTGQSNIYEGTLEIPQGLGTPGGTVTIGAPATFATAGVVQRPISGAGTLTAAGTLYVGMPTSASGFAFDGTLNVGTANVQLMDADAAGLGTLTTLASGGRLGAANGALLAAGRTLTATGSAAINGTFTNQGTVNGPTAAGQFLTFVDDVNGAGSYTGDVAFSDAFSPGNSPAIVTAQNLALDGTSVLDIELGGTTAGAGYDRVDASGTVAFAGALAVQTINGYVPLPGQTFEIVRFAGRSGDFATVVNQTPFAGLRFNRTYGATALTLTAWALPGDADLSGHVDLTDFTFLASHFNTTGNTWLTGDFDGNGNVDLTDFTFLAAHFNESTPAADGASSLGASVPEPAVTMIPCVAAWIGLCQRRRRCR